MTILEYIRSKVRVEVTEDNVKAVLVDRNLLDSEDDEILNIEQRMRELLYADILMLIATSANTSGGGSSEHGGFSQRKGSEVIHSTDRFTKMAMDIYKKWSDDKYISYESLTWIDNEY